ncbi:fibrinogen C domain-containing protein 1-A-like isoform X2 [Mytilus californianus]|uniref:fibrinogen C domain-containing protein 1-A-like isoform X2 n=1 Tax=Mytilus californianus TaxID=6549 RepID=UPI0022475847|nr:fibrinogen C domain-containing protein 1-A-like isoform X2 [Mytilus californianus]
MKMLVRHLIVLTIGSICFGNPDGTYIAQLIDDTQRAPLVALLNTSDISQSILKSFGKQLKENVDNLINPKFGDIYHRIQELEGKCKTLETDRSAGIQSSKDIRDCSDLPKDSRSGIYRIKPDQLDEFDVYCEMTIDHGGWTVIQRRESGDLDFYLGWAKYKKGFGQLNREFWLGDSLDYSNSGRFTTLDRDNDEAKDNCARRHPGAWWYKDCMHSNLNGYYYIKTPVGSWNGIIWYHWKGAKHSLKATAMMIRRL